MEKGAKNDMVRLSNLESQRLSQESLLIALFTLLGEKELEEISVTELTSRAGVSRNAFYRNFGTKENLMESLASFLSDTLRKAVPPYGRAKEEDFVGLFEKIQEEPCYFRILLSFRKSLLEKLMDGEEGIQRKEDGSLNYQEVAWKGALLALVVRWFEEGMEEPPQEMGRKCMGILGKGGTDFVLS